MAKRRRAKRRRRTSAYLPAAILLMLLAVVIGLSAFFKIRNIEVEGLSVYSPEEVIKISGIEKGDNLFLLKRSPAVLRIRNAMPYISAIQIFTKLPNTVVIQVTESYPIAYIKSGVNRWLIDKDGKLLEKVGEESSSRAIEIIGVDPIQPTAGSKIALGEAGATKASYLASVLNAIESYKLYENITWLDISNVGEIKFDYLGRFTVILGGGERATDKLSLLLRVAEDLGANEKGKINLSKADEARFIPE